MDGLQIKTLDGQAMQEARKKLDGLLKPLGSLGKLEEYAVQLAGIRGYVGGELAKKLVLVFAADNGVHEEGVSAAPQKVTQRMAQNIAEGLAGVNVLANQVGADVLVYNAGMRYPARDERILGQPVMHGTRNMLHSPAMSRGQCEQAVQLGFDAAQEAEAYDILGIGEMGIGNTSTASAVGTVLTGRPAHAMVGRGAGLTREQHAIKVGVVERAVAEHRADKDDPIDVLSKVGGLDIAAMAGAYLGAATVGRPVVIDGLISAVAALCAVRMAPGAREYMFASHRSDEPGYAYVAHALNIEPALTLNMRLGEGSGTPLMFALLESALAITDGMGSFLDGGVDPDDYVDIRDDV